MSRLSIKELVRPYYLKWFYFRLFPQRRPSYFADSWRYPRLTRADLESSTSPAAPAFLFLPMMDWHTRLQRPQHLATALAGLGHSCLYLNPHLGREFPHPLFWRKSPLVTRLAERVSEIHVHLPREPVYHSRLLSRRETRRLANALATAIGDLAPASLVQVVSLPVWMPVAEELRRRFGFSIIYDCHDMLAGFHNMDSAIVEAESSALERSDLALFSSDRLQQEFTAQLSSVEAKSLLLRNAVESERFFPSALNPKYVAGYMGALDHWFDIQAVAAAAEQHPEWRFILIGRVEFQPVLELKRYANVEFRGEIAYADLPAAAQEFSAGMIPFLRNELTLATNPIKLYEYFSMGLPVVSTDLPEVSRYADLVYIANTSNFADNLNRAFQETDPGLRQKRLGVAAQENWTSRAKTLIAAASALTTSRNPSTPDSRNPFPAPPRKCPPQ